MNNNKVLAHVHCQESKDSPMSSKQLVARAKELGYEAVILTDHGTLTGIDDFVEAAHNVGIKPILGIEGYMYEDNSLEKYHHIILFAKDDLGYTGIAKATTDANKRIGTLGFPLMNKEILERYFSEGKPFHDHVICTSACMGGIIGGLLNQPFVYQDKICKLEEKKSKYTSINSPSYIKNKQALEEEIKKLDEYRLIRDELNKLAKKPFKKKENALNKLEGTPEYKDAKKKLDEEKAESLKAGKALEEIKLNIAISSKRITDIRHKISEDDKNISKVEDIQEKIDHLKSLILSPDELKKKAIEEIKYYENLFGHENFYIELSYHGYQNSNGMEIEKLIMSTLANLAKETGVKVSAGQDSHIVNNSKESLRARQIVLSIGKDNADYFKIKPGDDQLYIKTEEEFRKALLNITDAETVDTALANTNAFYDICNFEFNYGMHSPKFKVKDGETADSVLRKMAYDNISKKFPNKEEWTEVYQERLEKELNVISTMGYSDYFLIVEDFLTFSKRVGSLANENIDYLKENIKQMSLDELLDYVEKSPKLPSFSTGAGRGSAAGSLVAYLVGITNIIDPIKYELLFERFLNKDRVSMPDVDSDISPDIRDLVIEYCKKLYGPDCVANIVTKNLMAPRGAVRAVARTLKTEKGLEYSDYYLSLANEIAKKIPNKIGISFEECEADLREAYKINSGDKPEVISRKKDANNIIDQAKLVEGLFYSYGMHAAGVIISDGHPISDYVPLMRDDKSGDMKVQCNMVQAESVHGLLKFDFLGLKNLKIVTQTLRSIYSRLGIEIDVEKLPFEDVVFEEIFSKGRTNSIFQFESEGMKNLLKKFKPTCFEDLIALVSLYRPGPMDFIPQYINAKYHPESINYLCPQLEPILGKTYGTIIYQEQVMEIFQKLAGYSLAQADNVRRFMSKKKHDKLAHEKESFIHGDPSRNIDGCEKRGISNNVAEELFQQMFSFASYAFNKSHAAAYAMLSYITAYLKYHYPTDYMCAILNCNDKIEKIPSIINDCKDFGVSILPPDINVSGPNFTAENKVILFGLNSVKGTKESTINKIIEERKNGEYTSFKNLMLRISLDKTSMENLISSGAMDSFSKNRFALNLAFAQADKPLSVIQSKTEVLATLREELAEIKNKLKNDTNNEISSNLEKEIKSLNKKITNAEKALETAELNYQIIKINEDYPENFSYRMKKEKEYLGFYITAHPLDTYKEPLEMSCKPIDRVSMYDKNVSVMGIVENLMIKKRKTDGKEMAFFDLEDKTGILHVCCFTKAYEEFGIYLAEDSVIKINGKILIENKDDEENEDFSISLSLEGLEELIPEENEIRVYINNIFEWNSTISKMKEKKYLNANHPLIFYDKNEGLFRKTKLYVSENILNDEEFEAEMFS